MFQSTIQIAKMPQGQYKSTPLQHFDVLIRTHQYITKNTIWIARTKAYFFYPDCGGDCFGNGSALMTTGNSMGYCLGVARGLSRACLGIVWVCLGSA